MMKNESGQPVPNKGLMLVKGILLIISFFGGAFGTFFFIWRQNYSASFACLELELICVILLNLNAAVLKGKLQEKYNLTRIKIVFIVSVIVAVATFAGSIGYAAMAVMNKQDFKLEGTSYYVAIIPASICCIWSTLLAFESRKHMATFAIGGGTAMGNMGQF